MELIKIEKSKGGKDVVSARELHKFLGVGTGMVLWVQRAIEKYDFKENVDYSAFITERLDNKQTVVQDYAVTIEMAKELAMITDTPKGKEARLYFIECEKKAIQQVQIKLPKTYAEALIEAGRLALEIEAKEALLLEQAPKVEFYDQVSQSTSEVSISEASKLLCLPYGSITLFKKLRELGVLMHDNIPYQSYIDRGWFRVVERKYLKKDNTWGIGLKTVVYQKGLDGIRKLLSK